MTSLPGSTIESSKAYTSMLIFVKFCHTDTMRLFEIGIYTRKYSVYNMYAVKKLDYLAECSYWMLFVKFSILLTFQMFLLFL